MWRSNGTSGAERVKRNTDFYDNYDFRQIFAYNLKIQN
jgi:hypothetical protein